LLEDNIIKFAKMRLEVLRNMSKNFIELQDVLSLYYEIRGLTELRKLSPCCLSDGAINELILAENLANLTMRNVNPEAIKIRTEQGMRFDEYTLMSERGLADLIFKEGGRFNNPDAVSVAIHRGIIDDVKNERACYERIERQERNNTES
jgi:hypothetical protein|tara:strand:+ start:18839 stop:19285 length:447 start_codon:yes stop_codon:yes gene_type:complete